jgi:hypothetical protein
MASAAAAPAPWRLRLCSDHDTVFMAATDLQLRRRMSTAVGLHCGRFPPAPRAATARGGRLLSKSRITPRCAAAQVCVPAAPILNFLVEALGGEASVALLREKTALPCSEYLPCAASTTHGKDKPHGKH